MPPTSAAPAEGPAATALSLTEEAEARLRAGQFDEAVEAATAATEFEDATARTWQVLAQAFEGQKNLAAALGAYGQALERAPESAEIAEAAGLLALRLGHYNTARTSLTTRVRVAPPTADTIAGLAWAQTKLLAFDDAHATLKAALGTDPGEAALWLTLGRLLCVQGRHAQAIVFLEEALRLEPGSPTALDTLAEALLLGAGDVDQAMARGEEALAGARAEEEAADLATAHGRRLLAVGRLADGWAAFAKGLEPGSAAVELKAAAKRWTPGAPVEGRVLLIGEENVIDELLLCQAVPGLLADGPPLILAVDPMWESLARRSFPDAMVIPSLRRTHRGRRQATAALDSPHVHGGELLGAWAPLRAIMPFYRGRAADFADARPYLVPDAAVVAQWRDWLSTLGPGPKVGLSWRPLPREGAREWETPPSSELAAALAVPGLTLVSMQQQAVMNEEGWLRDRYELPIHEPPPELLRENLDHLAAMAMAVDQVVGPPCASTFVAAACGAATCFITTPGHWALLGADRYPWLPQARVMIAPAINDWSDALIDLNTALLDLVARS